MLLGHEVDGRGDYKVTKLYIVLSIRHSCPSLLFIDGKSVIPVMWVWMYVDRAEMAAYGHAVSAHVHPIRRAHLQALVAGPRHAAGPHHALEGRLHLHLRYLAHYLLYPWGLD